MDSDLTIGHVFDIQQFGEMATITSIDDNVLRIKLIPEEFKLLNNSPIRKFFDMVLSEINKTSIQLLEIDFSNVKNINSSFIGVLFSVKRDLLRADENIDMELINFDHNTKKIMDFLKVSEVLNLKRKK